LEGPVPLQWLDGRPAIKLTAVSTNQQQVFVSMQQNINTYFCSFVRRLCKNKLLFVFKRFLVTGNKRELR
jgi:hypothetical protein